MASLFKRKVAKTPTINEDGPSGASIKSRKVKKGSASPSISSGNSPSSKLHLDDWGRQLSVAPPAFSSTSSNGGAARPSANGEFGSGYGIGDDSDVRELVLMYGYSPVATTLELSPDSVVEIVVACAGEILQRGLDTPLVLSTMSLDISVEETSSVIRSYVSQSSTWAHDLHLAAPLGVASFLKWGLARLINDKGTRGFLSWDAYDSWKLGERATSYPPRHYSTLVGRLPNTSAHLLDSLLTLFSSVVAHSSKNGLTPRKLAALFSPYCFGLSDDKSFDETYIEWQRATDAFEHMLLAKIRDQKAATRSFPTHLEKFIVGYPSILNISYNNAAPKVPKGGKVESVTRVRRLTRFHSRNLIQTAGTWSVPHSPDWSLFFPAAISSSTSITGAAQLPAPLFTASYRHLLNIRNTSWLDDDDDEGELQRYKTVVEKKWGNFCGLGFNDIDAGKLEFDLTESERSNIRAKHETLDWGTFASSGFGGRETFAPEDLIFHQNIAARVQTWPTKAGEIDQRLRETEKILPAFPYDTTPHEEGRILIDVNFFEAWADVLVSGGWARDELKESSFALVQWKSRPRDGEVARGRAVGNEDRTEERWVLCEEYVPRDYRDELRDGKKKPNKRASFMRSVRKKPKEIPRLNVSQLQITHPDLPPMPVSVPYNQTTPRPVDNSVFKPGPGNTKLMTLSNVNLAARTSSYSYAPSVSTTGAGHGHGYADSILSRADEDAHEPSSHAPYFPNGIGGATLSSQRRDSAFKGAASRGPVGFVKPMPTKGFLARISSKKGQKSPYSVPPSASSAHFSVDSYDMPTAPTGGASDDSSSTIHQQLGDNRPSGLPSNHSSGSLGPPPPPKMDNRQSEYSVSTVTSDDGAYDGIDDDESVKEGTVLFRGSRSFSQDAGRVALAPMGAPAVVDEDEDDEDDESQPPHQPILIAPQNVIRPLPDPNAIMMAKPIRPLPTPMSSSPSILPPRHDSLPPSPKPDAEVPIDEGMRTRDKFASGASGYSQSRVGSMVGMYEQRDGRDKDVRLTQFGFGDR